MGNQRNQVDPQESNFFAFVPHVAWRAAIFTCFLFLFCCAFVVGYFNHASIQELVSAEVTVFMVVIKVAGGLVVFFGVLKTAHYLYMLYHDGVLEHHQRKVSKLKVERSVLQNDQLRQQLEITKELPSLIRYAMEAGHNVEVSPKLDVKVTNYLSNIHTISGPERQALLPGGDYLPDPYKFSSLLGNWQPTKDGILLAKKDELITVPIGEGLCHTTFTGNTDAGKTNNLRFLMLQLLSLGQVVYLCDRNYQRYRLDKKTGVVYEYGPIEAQLAHEPIDMAKDALALMKYLYSELEDRRIARKKAVVPFDDIYLVMDELPAFCGDEPEIMEFIGRFLRESRQYGIFFIGGAQDLLNQTLRNDNGAVRENLLTNFYGGGDPTTARMVLNLAKGEQIDETGLGQLGVFYLRAKGANIERMRVRTPLSDNEATFTLLAGMPPREQREIPVVETPVPEEQMEYPTDEEDLERVVEVWHEGYQTLDTIMGATGWTQHKARVMLGRARVHGLIGDKEKNNAHTQKGAK